MCGSRSPASGRGLGQSGVDFAVRRGEPDAKGRRFEPGPVSAEASDEALATALWEKSFALTLEGVATVWAGAEPAETIASQWYASWKHAWDERVDAWWAATPLQESLRNCLGALGLHLSARLRRGVDLWSYARGTRPPPPPAPRIEVACEWVADESHVPDFPPFPEEPPPAGSRRFELPPIPARELLPRALWRDVVGAASAPSARGTRRGERGERERASRSAKRGVASRKSRSSHSFELGVSSGAVAGALCAAALLARRPARRRTHAQAVRSPA